MKRFALSLLLPVVISSAASAEDCSKFAPGPSKFACVSAKNPGAVAKRDRCQQEARAQGLQPKRGEGGAYPAFVRACMARR